jgi:tRNA(fMet)-specific endonuclease VapC
VAASLPGELGTSPVTIEEMMRGRLAVLSRRLNSVQRIQAYDYLSSTLRVLCRVPIIAFDQACEQQFQHLLGLRLRMGVPDLKIAAVALANNLILLTRNRRDFLRVPGLALADWTV